MNPVEMLIIVEQFSRNADAGDGVVKVIRIADSKTSYVETIGEIGRSIFFNEYKVDGKTYWAGHSTRSNTVFVSATGSTGRY
jgi:hypothetical protein